MQKIIVQILPFAVLVAVTFSVRAQNPPYYVDNRGNPVEAEGITADERGNLTLDLGDGATRTLSPADYRYAFVARPDRVARMERLFERNEYEQLLEEIESVYEEYRFLGWGGKLAFWQGRAELESDNPEAAREILERGERHAINDEQRTQIQINRTRGLLELAEYEEAERLVEELKVAEGDYPAAFSFFAKGRLLADRGDIDQAILELLKAVLLFEPRDENVAEVREEARAYLLNLLEARGDPAYERVRNLN